MAQIVLGVGSSHSPILLMEPEAWLARGDTDDRHVMALHDFTGKRVTFDEQLAVTPSSMADELTPEVLQARYEANERGIKAIADEIKAADPDVIVMIGDDHKEVFQDDNMPSLSVYWGETLPYRPTGLMKWKYAEDLKAEVWYPQENSDYPVASELALDLIDGLLERGFDPAHSKFYADNLGMSHCFGYIYHRVLTDKIWPVVPVNVNTYYPPNQVTPRRAYQIGKAIQDIIKSWPDDLRVVVLATGGLSHFVIDEKFDQEYIEILRSGGEEEHARLPREKLQSGNSEFRCWTTLAGAVEGMKFDLIDYVPCYRSMAGTGCAMAFATWKP